MSITVFTNAFLIDCTGADPVEGAAVVVEDDRIKEVAASGKVGALPGRVTTLDLRGKTLMPGLTDAHVHICAVTENITDQHRFYPPSYIAARAMKRAERVPRCRASPRRVTPAVPTTASAWRWRKGVSQGPRLLVLGSLHLPDRRPRRQAAPLTSDRAPMDGRVGFVSFVITDGPDEVRRAARDTVRRDVTRSRSWPPAASSPRRRLDATQFTEAEMRAAVEEAEGGGQVRAEPRLLHPGSSPRLDAGIRSIEHGNLIGESGGARAIERTPAAFLRAGQ